MGLLNFLLFCFLGTVAQANVVEPLWLPGKCIRYFSSEAPSDLKSTLASNHFVHLQHSPAFLPEFGRRLHTTLAPHRKVGLDFEKKSQFSAEVREAMEYFERYASGLSRFFSESGLGVMNFYHGKFTVRSQEDGLQRNRMGYFHLDSDDLVVSLTLLGDGTWSDQNAEDHGKTPTGIALVFDAFLRHAVPVSDADRVAVILRFSRWPRRLLLE